MPIHNKSHQPSQSVQTLIRVEDAAQRLGVGRTIVYRLISSGELPSVRIGRRRLIPVESIASYVAHLLATNPHAAA